MGAELHPGFLLAKARRGNGRGKGQLPSLCWLSRLSCLWSLLRSALLYITPLLQRHWYSPRFSWATDPQPHLPVGVGYAEMGWGGLHSASLTGVGGLWVDGTAPDQEPGGLCMGICSGGSTGWCPASVAPASSSLDAPLSPGPMPLRILGKGCSLLPTSLMHPQTLEMTLGGCL